MAQLNGKPARPDQSSQDGSPQSGSYISTLKHLSSKSKTDAKRNRMIERLRECTDMELATIGIDRGTIEQSVYGRKLA